MSRKGFSYIKRRNASNLADIAEVTESMENISLNETNSDVPFTHTREIIVRKGGYKGSNGFVRTVIPERIVVNIGGRELYFSEGEYKIENGEVKLFDEEYNGKTVTFVRKEPQHYVLDLEGKSNISHYIVNSGNGVQSIKITDNHLFFKDGVLGDGTMFQVNRMKKNGDDITVTGRRLNSSVEETIKMGDIKLKNDFVIGTNKDKMTKPRRKTKPKEEEKESEEERNIRHLRAFEINVDGLEPSLNQASSSKGEEQTSSRSSEEQVYDATDAKSETSEDENVEYEEEEVDERNEDTDDSNVQMATFRDTERTHMEEEKLDAEDRVYNNYIDLVLRISKYPSDAVNKSMIRKTTMELAKKIQEDTKVGDDALMWDYADTKYIIACLIFFEATRSGMHLVSGAKFVDYVKTLVEGGKERTREKDGTWKETNVKYFTDNDFKDSVFLKNTWKTPIVQVTRDMYEDIKRKMSEKDYVSIHNIVMMNCARVIESYIPVYKGFKMEQEAMKSEVIVPKRDEEQKEPGEKQYFSIMKNKDKKNKREWRMAKEEDVEIGVGQEFIIPGVNDIMPEEMLIDRIPDNVVGVVWTWQYGFALNHLRMQINDYMKTSLQPGSEKWKVLDFVEEALDQAPFVLRELEKNPEKNKNKIRALRFFYDQLKINMNEVKTQYENEAWRKERMERADEYKREYMNEVWELKIMRDNRRRRATSSGN